jgi:hypothetical protein
MANSTEAKDFQSRVDSIQSRFLENLITGQRDVMFREIAANRKPETEEARLQAYIDPNGSAQDR